MSMPAYIENFGDLLKRGVYKVPDYQRNYAWTKRELRDLWEDLGTIGDDGPAHFTGTIVIEKREKPIFKHGKTYQMYKVIDGQQRLATITILLFCVYERLIELAERKGSVDIRKTAENVLSEYIRDEDIFKVKLSSGDDIYLKDVILKRELTEMVGRPPQTPSEGRLKDAKVFFEKRLRDKDDIDYLNGLIKKITMWLQIIRYEVGRGIEACLLFEAMNDRGQPVSDIDKVKNRLIYTAYKERDEELASYVNEAWGEIFRNLMAIEGKGFDEDDLLRYHWATKYGGVAFNYRVFKEKISKSDGVLDIVKNYADSLKELSYVLREILDPLDEDSFKDWKKTTHITEIEKNLEGLRLLRAIATFIPLLLASRVAFNKSPAIFADITKLCEVYAFRVYKLANKRADTGKTVLYGVANEFFESKEKFLHQTEEQIRKTIKKALERILDYIHYYCDEEEFGEYLNKEDIYSSRERSWLEGYEVKYVLYQYEKWKRVCRKHKEPPPSWKDVEANVTIEHILPEKPEEYEKWSEDRRRTHKEVVHKLGNLTLATLEWNSSLGNKNFLGKKAQYQESTFLVQRELQKYDKWWKDEIDSRTKELIDFIMERWKIPRAHQ